ncbi:MAG: hypothetical protein JSW39_16555 [Desulfobacterales bacterium]|nr:MAG: hypothetical protein JSW39_16555 [Desulfobacterales bacterium]
MNFAFCDSANAQAMDAVSLDPEEGVGGGECVHIGPEEVFELEEETALPVRTKDCVGFESCVEVCEEGAIYVAEVQATVRITIKNDLPPRLRGHADRQTKQRPFSVLRVRAVNAI